MSITETTVKSEHFGILQNNSTVRLFKLSRKNGISVGISEFGSTLTEINTPDRNGNYENVIFNYPNLEGYITDPHYFGVLVGRYANRIKDAQFSLNDKVYELSKNDNNNHLHGGKIGLGKKLWTGKIIKSVNYPCLEMSYYSPENEEGYPGDLQIKVRYSLKSKNTLDINMEAETDAPTIVNLTQHPYFNLSGNREIVNTHKLKISADSFLPVNQNLIPVEKAIPVTDTVFDFRKADFPVSRFEADDKQVKQAGGFDHCWIFPENKKKIKNIAVLTEMESGRTLHVDSDAPGVQFYSGNQLEIEDQEHSFINHSAICLEPQSWPDSPNRPDFPATVLLPGKKYSRHIRYRFEVK